ncbi:MAG: ABC transporter permease [Christensenellales bacterium]
MTSNAKTFSGTKRTPMQQIMRHWQWYVVLIIPILLTLVFKYFPMYGAVIAFKQYNGGSIWAAKWVGFKHFAQFFKTPVFSRVLNNTLIINVYYLIACFPLPLMLALALNICRRNSLKKSVQMITYAPYFISTVVMVSIITQVFHQNFGIVNILIMRTGGTAVNFLGRKDLFYHMYVWTSVWQFVGYASIMYIAVLAGVDPTLHEAAVVDGASLFSRVIHIDIPAVIPTATILFIMNCGSIMNIGFEKVYLMQNTMNQAASEVISTYVYKQGLQGAQYSYSAAIGLFNSAINMIILIIVNKVSQKVGETSLW